MPRILLQSLLWNSNPNCDILKDHVSKTSSLLQLLHALRSSDTQAACLCLGSFLVLSDEVQAKVPFSSTVSSCNPSASFPQMENLPTPNWGMILNGGDGMRSYFHLVLFPGIAILITPFAFNFLGGWVRDVLDSRLK